MQLLKAPLKFAAVHMDKETFWSQTKQNECSLVFKWDSDPKHKSKVAKEWMNQARINVLGIVLKVLNQTPLRTCDWVCQEDEKLRWTAQILSRAV